MFITQSINEKLLRLTLGGVAAVAVCVQATAEEIVCRPAAPAEIAIESADAYLEIRLGDGRKLLLRGIEPPRGTPGNPQLAEQARAFLNARIAGRKLMADIGEGARDRWGRSAARLVDADGDAIEELLLRNGQARVDAGSAPAECLAQMLRWEDEARKARRGLWADPAYAILKASERAAFAPRAGEVVIVEGQVASVGQWRTLTFLNLGRDRRADPSVVLSRRLAAALEKDGRSAASLAGATIRVRGQLQVRTSPRIEIFNVGALEVLAPADKSSRAGQGTAR